MCNPFAKGHKTVFLEFITNNKKKKWKSVKPLFSDKITVKEITNLTENGESLSSDIDIADTFNGYFSSVVQNLNIRSENSMLNTDLCSIQYWQ